MLDKQKSLTIDEAKALRADPSHNHFYEFARLGELIVGICECDHAVIDREKMKRARAFEAFPALTASALLTGLEEIGRAIYTGDLELAKKHFDQTPEMRFALLRYVETLKAEIDSGIYDSEFAILQHVCGHKGECALFHMLKAIHTEIGERHV